MADEPSWRVFDRIAEDYDEVLPFFREFGERFVAVLDPAPGTRFLDLGAGRGALTGPALRAGCDVTAIDAAPAMIEGLRRSLPKADARVMTAQQLDLPDASFDVVGSTFVIHILDEPAAAVAEVFRVLVPGGRFAVSVGASVREPAPYAVQDAMDTLFAEFAGHLPGNGGMGAPIRQRDLLAAAGFGNVSSHHVEVTIPVPGGEALWQWAQSHGYRAFIDDLPERHRKEFRRRFVALPILADRAAARELPVLQRACDLLVATKPNEEPVRPDPDNNVTQRPEAQWCSTCT